MGDDTPGGLHPSGVLHPDDAPSAVSTAVRGSPAVAPLGSIFDHSHSCVAAAALDARGVGDRGTAGSSKSDTWRNKMDEAGLAAAVAAASSTYAKAPPFAGPTCFRAWGAEDAI